MYSDCLTELFLSWPSAFGSQSPYKLFNIRKSNRKMHQNKNSDCKRARTKTKTVSVPDINCYMYHKNTAEIKEQDADESCTQRRCAYMVEFPKLSIFII